ncbi:hypothetical protein B0P06_005201 [Clostridium saccharoperbutylacetonicum]|uniref:Uncharacterized protein n=1 Tax=Clostridium saccharoperbutylacetonicum N1-4(HMT) TaxID=931276 RepID=M1MP65_9CLOT|nr:hypothetical protein Cspa_c27630 [Clostridium saccharoperbutylacetonicum N1-4(HMT)]AQR95194.1 hypothetical protein CLSAP_25100 [Clostridium saccharoperbutylacetonicum]NRT62724.1 hypothetical protein [Clostridium saccharoperbutylacetonicum]NSB26075.1 hypothetical protein [Clostridium saccharoperbutylacetonicum]NSB31044.1 hypothetical protein [Clostridium saccharoperbutylacetonicum]
MNNEPINIYKDTFKRISKIENHEINCYYFFI